VNVLPFLLLVSPLALAQEGAPAQTAQAPSAQEQTAQGQGAQGQPAQGQGSPEQPAQGEAQEPQADAGQAPEGAVSAPGQDGYTPPDAAAIQPALRIMGYVDLGWAKAGGDGTSFSPTDQRIPADYGVDTFAPAVNSRGDVASTNAGIRFTNGFLPFSVGIGGHGSFLINTVDLDVRYTPPSAPLMFFARLQGLPRFSGQGQSNTLLVEQAFARWVPFSSQELAITAGKSDSVFGIEYLENEANLRTGITPSLIARYTTGQGLGLKAFYRLQFPKAWSAVSLNVSATNGGNMVSPLAPQSASLTGTPTVSARLGYELNLPQIEVKLGVSAMEGPRNDQSQSSVRHRAIGGDARVLYGPLEVRGEVVRLSEDEGSGDKVNDLGPQTVASGFDVFGGYVQAALGFALPEVVKRVSVYGRYDRRHAQFQGFGPITVDRFTAGARVDVFDALALKGEVLKNRELLGAPNVDNDVVTTSLVFSW
jgi:hypothetical protein